MIQTYKIILWKKEEPVDKTFDEISKETYEVLSILQNYPNNLRPNYMTSTSKNDIKSFEWDYKEFKIMLKKGINREGNNVFEDLGYTVSFYSDSDDYKTCGISVRAGNKDSRFVNSIIIDLPISLDLRNYETVKMVYSLFESLVRCYKPFWGCVSNRSLTRKYGRYIEDGLPTTLHWINYWSDEIINRFGRDRFNTFVYENCKNMFDNGIILIRDTALYSDKIEDVLFHERIHKQLFSEK